jgi:hypothetical protein
VRIFHITQNSCCFNLPYADFYKLNGRPPWAGIAEHPSQYIAKKSRPDSDHQLQEPSHMKSDGVDAWLQHWLKLQKRNKRPLILKDGSDEDPSESDIVFQAARPKHPRLGRLMTINPIRKMLRRAGMINPMRETFRRTRMINPMREMFRRTKMINPTILTTGMIPPKFYHQPLSAHRKHGRVVMNSLPRFPKIRITRSYCYLFVLPMSVICC